MHLQESHANIFPFSEVHSFLPLDIYSLKQTKKSVVLHSLPLPYSLLDWKSLSSHLTLYIYKKFLKVEAHNL